MNIVSQNLDGRMPKLAGGCVRERVEITLCEARFQESARQIQQERANENNLININGEQLDSI